MQSLRFYRWIQLALAIVLVAGLLVWIFVRAPESTSEGAIFGDVELTGRARQVALDTVRAVRQLAAIPPDATADQIQHARAQVNFAITAAERLESDLQTTKSRWIPVAEAAVLLEACRKLGALGLKLAPTGNPPSVELPEDSLASQPDLDGVTPEAAQTLEAGAGQLLDQSDRLAHRVQQAIVGATFAQGTILGFGARDLLLATTVLAALTGIVVLAHACRRLSIPAAKVEQMELELMGRVDRRAAMQKCHDRVRGLMEMAEQFARGQGV